jgi:nucleotide-binding universal stress UspA family protein
MAAQPGRYKKICVPLDGSGWAQRAVPHAVDIARGSSAEIILLHILQPPAAQFTAQLALAGQDGQIQEMREAIKQYLIGLRSELRQENLTVRTHVIEGIGIPGLICDYVNEEGVDLVVMSTHGLTGVARFIFGSVTTQVMQCLKVPILLIHPDREQSA